VVRFSVQVTRPAARDLAKLPERIRKTVLQSIATLERDPLPSPPVKKKLRGFPFPLYRLRAADYRVLYRIDESTVTVMRIIDRKDLEKTLRKLGK
jgi:mRNA-degrading endonuclease RelE of RelBE toxin-antitoxin system